MKLKLKMYVAIPLLNEQFETENKFVNEKKNEQNTHSVMGSFNDGVDYYRPLLFNSKSDIF